MKTRFIDKQTLTAALLLSFCGATGANSLEVDPSSILFLGSPCEATTVDDIAIDTQGPGRLNIDLNKMGPVDSVFESNNCTIKIPFTAEADKVNSRVTLSGTYTTPELQQIMTTISISRAGEVSEASVYIVKHSTSGEFEWQQPFEIDVEPDKENILKIVISLLLAPSSTDTDIKATTKAIPGNKNQTEMDSENPPALTLMPLNLTISHVVEKRSSTR